MVVKPSDTILRLKQRVKLVEPVPFPEQDSCWHRAICWLRCGLHDMYCIFILYKYIHTLYRYVYVHTHTRIITLRIYIYIHLFIHIVKTIHIDQQKGTYY